MADLMRPGGVDIYDDGTNPREGASNSENRMRNNFGSYQGGSVAEEDNIFSNRGSAQNAHQKQNMTQIVGPSAGIPMNKDNSALDLMGLGGGDQIDEFEEYQDEESFKIKDTTFQSDNL